MILFCSYWRFSMNKLFKPRCLRRIFLCLAMLFPIVYLCGGLFFGLAGAHGEQIYAEPVYSEQYIQVDDVSTDGSYRIELNSVEDALTETFTRFEFNYTFRNNNQTAFVFFKNNNVLYFSSLGGTNYDLATYTLSTSTYSEFLKPWVFYSDENCKILLDYLDSRGCTYSVEKIMLVPSHFVPENNSAYTDFIFSQPFAKDNFISTLGKDLVNGSTKGFNPMNELFRTINTNIMHFEDTDGLAMFGLGYVYYAVNVLIIYEILVLAVKLIILPLRAVDVFDKEDI